VVSRCGPDAVPMPSHVLISDVAIAQRTRELAAEIRRDYADGGQLHIVCVLKGAFMFLADLVRAIEMPVTLDFMALSSYANGTTSSGEVRLLKDLDSALEGRHVLIVEDIVDTGLTLQYLQDILAARGPKSVRTACLLSKPSRRKVDVRVEYIGFTIEDHFVVGYGLDLDERYRNLPHIAVVRGSG
jgi:hypoxanthine phosphoribosyltransferase